MLRIYEKKERKKKKTNQTVKIQNVSYFYLPLCQTKHRMVGFM